MRCVKCNKIIPKKRLKVLPKTETCVNCSEVKPLVGFMVWDKKTPELAVMEDADRIYRLERADGRLERL